MATKQVDLNELITQIKRLLAIIPDLIREVSRYIRVDNDLAERYARQAEEYDSNRLAVEEIRELIKEFIEESSRWADNISKRIDRLERYTILKGMGGGRETLQIEASVSREHIDRALREELGLQQELVQQYQKNIDKVRIKIAKFGDTVALLNELDDYQKQVERAMEAIARIRQSLAA